MILEWLTPELRSQIIGTIVLLVTAQVFKSVAMRRAASAQFRSGELRRRMIVTIRNVSLIFVLLGLFIIWSTQLRFLAISLFAVTAAIVLATKELILCLSGGVYRSFIKGCKIGDRIEISNQRGDIIDQTLMTTTILEIGPGQLTHQHTGRAVVLPNGIFLSAPLIIETFTDEYVAHTFQVPLKLEEDWKRAEQILIEACHAEVEDFLESARQHMQGLQQRHGLEAPSVDPRVIVRVPEAGKMLLIVRIPAPARKKGRIEQAIMRRFLQEFYQKEAKATEDKGSNI